MTKMSDVAYWRPRILDDVLKTRHAIIEASAGTGKTFTIEHLFVDLLRSSPITLEQILVVTFTEKATAELRARIRKLIETVLIGTSVAEPDADSEMIALDGEDRSRLERSLWAFDRASIFTIHGFCQRVLTDCAFLTGMSFDLKVVDARQPFRRAFRAVLRESIANGKEERTLLEQWVSDGGRTDDLEKMLLKAHQRRYLESAPADTRTRLDRRFKSVDVQKLGLDYRSNNLNLNPRQLNAALRALKELGRLIDTPSSMPAFFKLVDEFDFRPLTKATNTRDSRQLPNTITEFMQLITELQLAAAIENKAEKATETNLVETYLPAVRARLNREKREQGLVDYEDMLDWLLLALDSPNGAALLDTLRRRYRFGLADEFQDTDDVQWKILKRIFVDGEGDNRLFVVGDPKQAIYGFRGADVYAYLSACHELSKANAQALPLVTNFRSTYSLLDAVNHIFDQGVESPFFSGKIIYNDPARCGRPDLEAVDANSDAAKPIVIMRFLPSGGRPGFAAEARESIGRYIASSLRKMLSDAGRLQIQDRVRATNDAETRIVKPGDIFVLTRTRRESEEIGAYLREYGVPFAFYKLDGLFQTKEARDVLDVLRAIEEPQDRSLRLRGWGSRFFAVRYEDLPTLGDVPDSHPLNERLYKWSSMSEGGHFAELFDSLIHESGLAERELLLSRGERELTNFLHIMEVLLERAIADRLSLGGIIELLEDYIAGRSEPPGPDGNVHRIEGDREAVQVMTMHMSKGLEADVVFLFGGSHRNWQRDKLTIFHNEDGRKFAIGTGMQRLVADELKREEAEEDQRLLYVAVTRARAMVFLPFFSEGCTKTAVNGFYKPLNDRLKTIVRNIEADDRRTAGLFQIEDVQDSSPAGPTDSTLRAIAEWSPPATLLVDDSEPETTFERARRDHSALMMSSYTALKRAARPSVWSLSADEFKTDLEVESEASDLAGGSQVGIFLHDVIERILELNTFGETPDFESWRDRSDIKQLFRDSMRSHHVNDPGWVDRGREVVFKTLNTRFTLADGRLLGPLHQCNGIREMELIYPIPEDPHARTVERGFLKGFVDFVFEQEGLVYFADWKSDLLPSYHSPALEEHVKHNYTLQAQIYLVGIIKLLRLRTEEDYAKRFGGLLYVFLRGVSSDNEGQQGLYFHRPAWEQVVGLENELIDLPYS